MQIYRYIDIYASILLVNPNPSANHFSGMNKTHLGIVGLLGGIGFTMCLLLTEVAMPLSQVR